MASPNDKEYCKRINYMKSHRYIFLTIFIIICIFIFTSCISTGQEISIISDHTSASSYNNIPDFWIEEVKGMVLHHTGESHGIQVPHGLETLEIEDSTFSVVVSTEGIPSETDALKVTRGQRNIAGSWFYLIGVDWYWLGEAGKDWTRRTLDYHTGNGDTVHASLHTWCWHLRDWSEYQVADYLSSMETLEAEYPEVTFIYMTDTCDTTGDTGYNRWLRNEQIRQYCIEKDKVLFDFADLEAWSADGTEQSTYFHEGSGLNIPYWHEDWSTGQQNEFGHINEAGTVMKAKAMWWLLARIAGWDGQPE